MYPLGVSIYPLSISILYGIKQGTLILQVNGIINFKWYKTMYPLGISMYPLGVSILQGIKQGTLMYHGIVYII